MVTTYAGMHSEPFKAAHGRSSIGYFLLRGKKGILRLLKTKGGKRDFHKKIFAPVLSSTLKMKKIITSIIIIVVLTGCETPVLFKDSHPELNRVFRLGIDIPGEYPY